MPFGLVNAPAALQHLMEVVLVGVAREECLVYLEHDLVMGRTLEEHGKNLRTVLDQLGADCVHFKPKKCFFI